MRFSTEEAWKYWSNPPDVNTPDKYALLVRTSEKIVRLFETLFPKDILILELGCNMGRNLNALYINGFENVYGIDINKDAISMGKNMYPPLSDRLTYGAIEYIVGNMEDDKFDLIFSNAVLQHVAYDSDWIFPHIARVSRKYICTTELETVYSFPYERNFPRNYKEIFERLGLKEVNSIDSYVNNMYITRLFEK